MGGPQDVECADLNRRVVQAIYQGIGTESAITPDHGVDLVGPLTHPGIRIPACRTRRGAPAGPVAVARVASEVSFNITSPHPGRPRAIRFQDTARGAHIAAPSRDGTAGIPGGAWPQTGAGPCGASRIYTMFPETTRSRIRSTTFRR